MAEGSSDGLAKHPQQQRLTDIIELEADSTKMDESDSGSSNTLASSSPQKDALPEQHKMRDPFLSLFENISEAAILTDGKKIFGINEAMSRMSGYTRQELVGSRLASVVKKDKVIKKDQTAVDVNRTDVTAGDMSVVILRDEGVRLRLERSAKRLSALEQFLPNPILNVGKNGRIFAWNDSALSFFGEKLAGSNIKDFVGRGSKIALRMKTAIENRSVERVETACTRENGTILDVEILVLPMDSDLVCVINDISERNKLKHDAVSAKEQYEQLVNDVSDIILITDTKGNLIFKNRQFERQLGYKTDTTSLVPLIHHEDLPDVLKAFADSERTGKSFQNLEFRLLNSKKKYLYFSGNGVTLKDRGAVNRFSITMRDITVKKTAEDETAMIRKKLEEESKKLREVNQLKSDFVSNVSHDLRTPLTNIQGYASLMRNGLLGANNPKQQEASDVIHKESVRLSRLINDLLDLSKLDAGTITLHKQPFWLDALEEKCSCRTQARDKQLSVIWNTPRSIGEVYGDPERIMQVLTNLVSNAIKFTDKGTITVNAFSKDRNTIQIDVIDTGVGIPKKEWERIFERFYRGTPSKIVKKESGSGLGLAIAKEVVRHHGGSIWVSNSEIGKGTTISFTIQKAPKKVIGGQPEEIQAHIENIGKEQEEVQTERK